MDQELVVRPEELFYVGKQMDGLYYNYDYYSAIPAVDQGGGKKLLWGCESSLAERGLLEENDEGDLTVSEAVKQMLQPIFFGERQAKVVSYPDIQKNEGYALYFHWFEDQCRMVWETKSGFSICAVKDSDVLAAIGAMLPDGHLDKEPPAGMDAPNQGQVTQVISVCSTVAGGAAKEMRAAVADGWLCLIEDGALRVLSPAEFYGLVSSVMKEEV